nr:ATP-binding cassette domain-containing protein [uncultured Niameybacter sp.]
MIKVTNLTKTFTKTIKSGRRTVKEVFNAVDNLSFDVPKGQIYGILGPNGAGKTTLLRMLGGILTPTLGSIEVGGINYDENKNKAKELIGYLSGNTKLYGRLSSREVLEIFGGLYGMEKQKIEEEIERIIHLLNMQDFVDNPIQKLSTGQTQRASIARCLIHSPELYIFDEPTLGLDVLSSRTIIDFMKSEKEKGKTVLYSTHYMEEAETLCDQMIMLHEGRILATGTSQELKDLTKTTNLRDAFIKLIESREELG